MASLRAVAVMALGLPITGGQAAIERAEGGLGPAETHGGQSEDRGGAIGGRPGATS